MAAVAVTPEAEEQGVARGSPMAAWAPWGTSHGLRPGFADTGLGNGTAFVLK